MNQTMHDSPAWKFGICSEPINSSELITFLEDSVESGGICTFNGQVRNQTKGVQVKHLEYEAYETMVLEVMNSILSQTKELYNTQKLLLIHRVGIVYPGESAVFLGASTAHRADAFAACRHLIEEVKARLPIFKKEFFNNGSHWVSAHP